MADSSRAPLLIIDGYGFIFRAYHVQPPLTSPDGQPVGAIYGFASMLLKLINDFKPEYAVVVLDSKGKNHRHHLYEAYKANRPPAPDDLVVQLAIVDSAAKALNFSVIAKEGFEADDIIATIATRCQADKRDAVIISSDKDLLQLMSDHVKIYDPVKAKLITENDVLAKFGVLPNKVREVQALIGDSSDNIPGVRGIGPKTASELINNFGDVSSIYNAIEQVKSSRQKQLLMENKSMALISWELVGLKNNINLDIDLEAFIWQRPPKEQIAEFLLKFGFRSLVKRAEALFNITLGHDNIRAQQQEPLPSTIVEVIDNEVKLAELKKNIETFGVIGVDFTEDEQETAVIFSVGDGLHSLNYHYERERDLFSFSNKSASAPHNDFIDSVFADPAIQKITTNLKRFYKNFSGGLNAFDDLLLMDYCLSAGKPLKSAVEVINYYLQQDLENEKLLVAFYSKCFLILQNELFRQKTLHLYKTIDLPLSYILNRMENKGIKIDVQYLKKLSEEFAVYVKRLETEIIAIAGEEFNVASPKQLGDILFNKLKLPFAKISAKSKTFNTSAEVLEKLAENGHKIAELLLNYRHLTKLRNTYTDTLPKQADPSGRVHTTFLQSSTTTGRLSSQDPNLQNIPARTAEGAKIRAAFVAATGHKLISADYSQIELRILCHMAKIAPLKEAFAAGEDIHKKTASQIFGIPLVEVTDELRRNAKAINFGIIYGISAFGLAKNLNISKAEAADYIARYFKEYPGIQKYMQETINFAKEKYYVENLLGRRCYLPTINHNNSALRAFAERAAINAPMQSLTADIAKMAMVAIDKKLEQGNHKTKMLLQIHDELLFEAPASEVEEISKLIKTTMENIMQLDVPLKVDLSVGNNWQEL